MPAPNIQHAKSAVLRIQKEVASCLLGGPDISQDEQIIATLDWLKEHCPSEAPKKLTAMANALQNPSLHNSVNRSVILARAQRYLMTLAIYLEDQYPEEASPKRRASTANSLTAELEEQAFDPKMLTVKGIGPKSAARLASRGIRSIADLLYYLPIRYEDRRQITPIDQLAEGQRAVTSGIISKAVFFGPRWKKMLRVTLEDGAAKINAVWFSQMHPPITYFESGKRLYICGIVTQNKSQLQIAHPITADDGNKKERFGKIVPIYPDVPGIPPRTVEKFVKEALHQIDTAISDPIAPSLISAHQLLPLKDALMLAHAPPLDATDSEMDDWMRGDTPAQQRLAYDEFFYLQLALGLKRNKEDMEHGAPTKPSIAQDLANDTFKLVGFAPTAAQSRVIEEIAADMTQSSPMRRLLQGDVGSGKTMVALAAIIASVKSGYQAVLMAPTEILAEQHMKNLYPIFKDLGIKCMLHLGAARSSQRKKFIEQAMTGTVQVAIGTHALLQESVRFRQLGLAVIDEQHRFGVSQRLGLSDKSESDIVPHLLVMTATPIPRSLALTVHGDLDISVLDELPPGRHPISTRWVDPEDDQLITSVLRDTVARNEQAYVVCPAIDPCDRLKGVDAMSIHQRICDTFGEDTVGLLHGQLAPEDRTEEMARFLTGNAQILVATTVIEVGVDVKNATSMVIMGAQQFGMATLHQLRGRVGRSDLKSQCLLVADPAAPRAMERINSLIESNDGFHLAEADLRQRGPGELWGTRQAGLPGFRFANLQRDQHLLELARTDARQVLSDSDMLKLPSFGPLRTALHQRILNSEMPIGEEAG